MNRRQRHRVPSRVVDGLLERLTDRDRQILDLVWQHRVFTTDQLTAMFFTSVHAARHRLADLRDLQALIRSRPSSGFGPAPYRWALGPAGAHVVAAWRGVEVKELRYRLDKTQAFLLSQKVPHQLGVNDFFAQLHVHARRPGTNTWLEQWWHEHRCHRAWGLHAHPDAFGRWVQEEPGQPALAVEFFLEHDTGTEPLQRVVAKLCGYAELAEETQMHTPVLFWLPSHTREINLRRLLGTPQIPVATAVHTTAEDGPAGAVWLPAGVNGRRLRLAELADAWTSPDQPRPLTSNSSFGSAWGPDENPTEGRG